MYRLVYLNGENKGRRQPLHRRHIRAGSDLACLLWIGEEGVAPQQAEFSVDLEGQLHLRDLSGPTGTVRVNGEPVSERLLIHGDRVTIGPRSLRIERHQFNRARWVRTFFLASLALWLLRPAWNAWHPARVEPPPAAPMASRPALDTFTRDAATLDEMEELDQQTEKIARAAEATATDSVQAIIHAERRRRAGRVLEQARQAAQQNRFTEAHRLLQQLQTTLPDFLPAYAEKARIYERQGRRKEAEEHWLHVLRNGASSPLFGEAADALNRLAVRETPPLEPPAEAAENVPGNTGAPTAEPRVRITRMEPLRFPGTREFDEMRILRFTLETASGSLPHNVFLTVQIFDRQRSSGRLYPTRAMVAPKGRIPLPRGPWPAGGKTVTVSYVVPSGQREKFLRETGHLSEYAGFVARVYVGKKLQDQMARPSNLASLIGAPP